MYGECEVSSCRCCMFVSCVHPVVIKHFIVNQCCVLHDLQFVNAGRECNRRE